MKTAMQELIDIVTDFANRTEGKENLRIKKAFLDVICAIDDFELIEKEKQQIIDACYFGSQNLPYEIKDKSKDYYNETFKDE